MIQLITRDITDGHACWPPLCKEEEEEIRKKILFPPCYNVTQLGGQKFK